MDNHAQLIIDIVQEDLRNHQHANVFASANHLLLSLLPRIENDRRAIRLAWEVLSHMPDLSGSTCQRRVAVAVLKKSAFVYTDMAKNRAQLMLDLQRLLQV